MSGKKSGSENPQLVIGIRNRYRETCVTRLASTARHSCDVWQTCQSHRTHKLSFANDTTSLRTDDTSRASFCSFCPGSGSLLQSWSYSDDVIAADNGYVVCFLQHEVHVLVIPGKDAVVRFTAFQGDGYFRTQRLFEEIEGAIAHVRFGTPRKYKRTGLSLYQWVVEGSSSVSEVNWTRREAEGLFARLNRFW